MNPPCDKTSCINILLADDQRLFADNLKLMLETLSEDIHVTGGVVKGVMIGAVKE